MPTHNRANFFLPRAIQSVLNQTYNDWQLVISDDVSTDNTKEVVAGFKNKRILYTKNKISDGGPYPFYNRGLAKYKTKYIAFLEDDNIFYPQHIEKLIDKAKQGYDVVYCWAMNVLLNKQNIPMSGCPRGKQWDKNFFMFASSYFNWIDQSDILVDRKALINVGGFREDAGFQDYAIIAKLCMRYKIGCVPEILTEYSIHETNSKYMTSGTLQEHMNIF